MQNDWRIRTVVVGVAAIAAATVFAQWPFSLPLLGADAGLTQTQRAGKVSLSGDAVPAKDVFAQLRKAGANFVVDDAAVPLDRRLSLNLVDQDPETALKAVAKALGMTATKEGDVLVLAPGIPFMPNVLEWKQDMGDQGDTRDPFFEWKGLPDKSFELDLKELERSRPKFEGDKVKEMLKDFPGLDRNVPRVWFGETGPDFAGLAKSLTPEQRALHEKQGYLTLKDLTAAQKKLVGGLAESKGDFEVTFVEGDTKLRLKKG